jgi:acetoacetyl-CoA synthetase
VTESTSTTVTWQELRNQVLRLVLAMKELGIKTRDRVAGFLGNHANTVVAMLATTYLGAIWTAVSPDTGVAAVLDRLVQIEPVLLFADNGVGYNGRTHSSTEKTREIAEALTKLKAVVVFPTIPGEIDISNFKVAHGKAWTHEGFLQRYVRTEISPSQISH